MIEHSQASTALRETTMTHGDMSDLIHHRPPLQQSSPSASGVDSEAKQTRIQSSITGFKSRYTPSESDPWIQMKFAVGILIALSVWSFYVVVGRVCATMIRNRSSTGLGVGVGVVNMIIYVLLFFLFIWSYIKMIVTGPGFAKDYVQRTAPPMSPSVAVQISYPSQQRASEELPLTRSSTQHVTPRLTHDDIISDPSGPDPSTLAPVSNLLSAALHQSSSRQQSSSATLAELNTTSHGNRKPSNQIDKKVTDWRLVQRPVPKIESGPRWCRFCQINKPDRTHHCRHCGTCVLQFDHHCLWVGQCVGWGNHKFFMIFCFWGMLFCFHMMIFLIVVATKDVNVDGQVVGLIAVSALFGLFTFAMLTTHIHLILTGRSTVESFKGRDQMEQEDHVLQLEYGYLWHNKEKRKVKQRWKKEWGGTSVDERWRWGTPGQLWREEMGPWLAGWIFPIGRPQGDGVHYRSNPRFGPNGEWLQKKDWPRELATA